MSIDAQTKVELKISQLTLAKIDIDRKQKK